MKKLLCILACTAGFTMLANSVCFAADASDIDIKVSDASKGIVTVNGISNNKELNSNVSVIVVDGEHTLADYGEYTVGAAVTAGEYGTGAYSVQIGMSGLESGVYKFYVTDSNGTYEKEFNYVSQVDVISAIDDIVSGKTAKGSLFNAVSEINNGLGADLKLFTDTRTKTIFEKRVDENRKNINTATDDLKITSLIKIVDNINGEIEYLNKIKNAKIWNDVKVLLADTTYTKADLTSFNNLNGEKQAAVCTAIMGRDVADADALRELLYAQVSANPNDDGGKKGGSKSSGGSGSGSIKGVDGDNSYVSPAPGNTDKKYVFGDIADVDWASDAITALYLKGIVNGDGNGSFNPNGLVTREQFAKMLVISLGIETDGAVCNFTDAQNGWYTPYIAAASKCGIINGTGNNMFGTGENITREDMAVMVYNAFLYKEYALSSDRSDFKDFANVSDYAAEAVKKLAGEGVLNGSDDGNFLPNDNTTRAEAAVVINTIMGRLA